MEKKELTRGFFKWVDNNSSSSDQEKQDVFINLGTVKKKICQVKKEIMMYEGQVSRLRRINKLLAIVVIILLYFLVVLYFN